MMVQPKCEFSTKRYGLDEESVKQVPSDDLSLIIECVVISPPSSKGKTVYLRVPKQQVTAMLLASRRVARQMRMETLS